MPMPMVIKKECHPDSTESTEPVAAQTQSAQYTARELSDHAERLFACHPDIAEAALAYARMEQSTIDRARAVVKQFAERKV